MLYVDVKINETLKIGDIRVTIIRKSGRQVRLAVDADMDIPITQYLVDLENKEVYQDK